MGIDAEMFVRVPRSVSPTELKECSYIFGSAFHDYLRLGIREEIWHHPLEEISKWEQDGPDIIPKEGETFIKVPLSGRYYGPGYERGPLMLYIQIAEFLERLFPDGTIYYGGDSSGVCAEEFTKARRELFLSHFIHNKGKDNYGRYFDRENDGPLCPVCDVKMIRNGWGPNYKAFSCYGCGWHHSERDGIVSKGFGD